MVFIFRYQAITFSCSKLYAKYHETYRLQSDTNLYKCELEIFSRSIFSFSSRYMTIYTLYQLRDYSKAKIFASLSYTKQNQFAMQPMLLIKVMYLVGTNMKALILFIIQDFSLRVLFSPYSNLVQTKLLFYLQY